MSDADTKAESRKEARPESPRAPVKPLNENSFWEHGAKQMVYDAWAEAGVQPRDLLARDYWAHVASRLRSNTKIHVTAVDRSWYVELLVWHAYSNGAQVAFIHQPIYADKAGITQEEAEFEVFDGGLAKKWSVRRRKDGKVFIDGCETQQHADMELRNWIKAHGTARAA